MDDDARAAEEDEELEGLDLGAATTVEGGTGGPGAAGGEGDGDGKGKSVRMADNVDGKDGG